jgi:MoxR-like ATPase
MLTNQSVLEASASLRAVISATTKGLVEREALVEMIVLSAVAEEHVLVIGPPGTAKSEAVRRIARATGGQYFEYLLGRFTEPSEIFGPVDLHKLKDGLVETDTLGMLPEADIAFLDEIFQGSTAILNTLLGILNERVFRRGHTNMRCPLRVCVGASNSLPEDAALAAFADRFLVRCFVDPIPDPMLEQLLEHGWSLNQSSSAPSTARLNDIEVLTVATRKADMSGVRQRMAQAIRTLRGAGITLTDRRAVRAQKLIAAAALMAGRDKPSEADLWPIIFVLPTREQQSLGRDSLRDLLSATENATLPVAAEEASLGPLARATRVAQAARQVLDARPDNVEQEQNRGWRLQLEGIAREIDAGFTPEQMPAELVELRVRIIEVLGQSS